ncbi:MAG: GTPase Era [Clostridia bacterium]|nr:GTPase Era [Clostridia bacterium]
MTKTAFIAIVGRPNVGKSTLLNAMLGEKISIVSNKPQTTRNRITGILTKDENQFVFLDTPGIHKPHTKLGDYMVKAADSAISSSSVIILITEVNRAPTEVELSVIEAIKKSALPSILVLNKIDIADPTTVAKAIETYAKLHDFDSIIPVSAENNDGTDIVLDECAKFMNESAWFFPDDIATDQPERQIVAEVIREKLLRLLDDEVPHGTAVTIESFEDTEDIIRVRAEIFCEKESHKGIIIGKNGATLKKIGTYARQDLEKFFGVKVYLNLWVKVKEKWRDSTFNLNNFGYNPKDF